MLNACCVILSTLPAGAVLNLPGAVLSLPRAALSLPRAAGDATDTRRTQRGTSLIMIRWQAYMPVQSKVGKVTFQQTYVLLFGLLAVNGSSVRCCMTCCTQAVAPLTVGMCASLLLDMSAFSWLGDWRFAPAVLPACCCRLILLKYIPSLACKNLSCAIKGTLVYGAQTSRYAESDVMYICLG